MVQLCKDTGRKNAVPAAFAGWMILKEFRACKLVRTTCEDDKDKPTAGKGRQHPICGMLAAFLYAKTSGCAGGSKRALAFHM